MRPYHAHTSPPNLESASTPANDGGTVSVGAVLLLLAGLVLWVVIRRTCRALALAHRRALVDGVLLPRAARPRTPMGDEGALLLPLHGVGPSLKIASG